MNKKIVILTGAGISAESGIATFRGAGGLWEGHEVQDVATPEAFARNPDLVQRFYNERRRGIAEKEPNAAHHAIAELQQRYPGQVVLITQNIDDLHERGGSPEVIHMHGEALKARCLSCGSIHAWLGDLSRDSSCPACARTGQLRPHIVWFGEVPLFMDDIISALAGADIFAAVGTSGQVYPAAGFVDMASRQGARCIEFNLDPTPSSGLFHETRPGPATKTVADWTRELMAG